MNTETLEDTDGLEDNNLPPADNDEGGDPSPEEQAHQFGWRPQEEWTGPKDKWVDAETFLKAREENLAIAKQDNKRLNEINRDLSKKLKRMEAMVEQVKGFEARAYERAIADIKAEQRKAVELGDTEAFEALDKQADELRKNAPRDEKPAKVSDDELRETFEDWLIDNPWYAQGPQYDQAKAIFADRQIKALGAMQDSELSPTEYLAEVTRRVDEKFAPAEQRTQQRKPNPVNGQPALRNGQPKPVSAAGLNAEERAMADLMIKQGIFKNADDYAKALKGATA